MASAVQSLKINKRKIRALADDPVKSAEVMHLVYVSDKQPGIKRIRKDDGFTYAVNGRKINTIRELSRINSLVIPPAWEQVWICAQPNGHIQATGIDARGRKQYRYHPLWNALRKETKFFRLFGFGKALPLIRKQVKEDISLHGLPLRKILALIVALMQDTGIRIGNNFYEKVYGTYGITTLKNQHVNISGNEIRFRFTGKKGVHQHLTLKSRKLAGIVQQCKDIPGKELFQYYDENGNRHPVDSGMVNNYIREICDENFTAKDFRTWFGTICALEAFLESECAEDEHQANKKIIETLDIVAKRLGNTRTVCRKYYVHPVVISHYSGNKISSYVSRAAEIKWDTEFHVVETILMTMLDSVKEVSLPQSINNNAI